MALVPRLEPPALADGVIALAPLAQRDAGGMLALTRVEDVMAYTRVPAGADAAFVRDWIERYERGWADGTAGGFSIRDAASDAFLGFAAAVRLELEERQAELGYMVAPAARGRGVARRSLELLTRWCFEDLGLERLELRIEPSNAASVRIAERAGYELEGVLRSVYFKDGLRCDVGIWSRLRAGAGPPPAPARPSYLDDTG
jgi:[ribosomal protein S5]-alanine N-acetyltransferase